jgi:hypothetical protein
MTFRATIILPSVCNCFSEKQVFEITGSWPVIFFKALAKPVKKSRFAEIHFIMKTFNKAALTILLTCMGFIWWSCKKDDANPIPSPGPSTEKTTITVRVTDAAGNPLSGVNISAGGKTGSSTANGTLTLTDLDASSGRIVVKGIKTGYFDGIKGMIPEKNSITKLELIMPASTADFNGNSTQNADFISNGSGIEIPANSLTGSGNFSAAIEHISPDDPDFERMIPGGDLLAEDAAGRERQLFSYGMLMVKLTDASGNEINLASGKTATIRMKIAGSQLATAPASIPLWHLDESTGKWKEEGSATRQGDQYVGTVSHFSSWNCDEPEGRSTIKGIIKDCKGKPLEGIRVRVGQNTVFTNASGQYQTFVPAGTAFDVAVDYPELGLSSSPLPVNPIAEGATQTVPDISITNCISKLSFSLSCSGGGTLLTSYNISWGQGEGQSVYGLISGSGTKTVPIPSNGQNATYIFQNALTGQTVSGSFNLPSQTDTLDKGTFNLCGDTTIQTDSLRTSMIINGDGFNNQLLTWSGSPAFSFFIYSPVDSGSIFTASSPTGLILTGGLQGFPRTGQFTDNEAYLTVTLPDGRNYFPDSAFVLNITQMGNVGQRVNGTFSGRFARADLQGGLFQVYINSGSFQFIRRPNQ